MPKTKKMALNILKLHQHPMLVTMLSSDYFELSTLPEISTLSIEQIQIILDTKPIAVVQTTAKLGYLLLEPMPILDVFRHHPQYAKLNVTLLIYESPEPALTALTIIKPALQYSQYRHLPETLHYRLNTAKSAGIQTPSRKQLGQFANLSASAIRALPKKRGQ
jgi:hypothetical protein